MTSMNRRLTAFFAFALSLCAALSAADDDPYKLSDTRIETIRSIVQKDLSAGQRELLSLRNENGLSLDEIAAVTGRPKTSVKVTLSTARRKMMEQLKKMK